MRTVIDQLPGLPVDQQATEIVERKGLGHPDSICDALAERFSVALSRFYLERFGLILHHNVDKALLRAGKAGPAFGGGKIVAPMEIYLTGRATEEFHGVRVPLEELCEEGSNEWFRRHFHALDPESHVRVHSLTRGGSPELVELFLRQRDTGVWLANDTSCGVGYAPLSELEQIVDRVERHLSVVVSRKDHPQVGQDVKVMGIRHGDELKLTVACALVDRHIHDIDQYLTKKLELATIVLERSQELTAREVSVEVNAADDPSKGSVYVTVTGTSAEGGDDGQSGRGNRVNGLITPYRPMTMESVAGKNPVTHVGKLYNVTAGLIADAVHIELPEVTSVECYLLSRIGQPVGEPQAVHVRVRPRDDVSVGNLNRPIRRIVERELGRVDSLWRALLDGSVKLDRWPLRIARSQPAEDHVPSSHEER